jgi:hypothetical protein
MTVIYPNSKKSLQLFLKNEYNNLPSRDLRGFINHYSYELFKKLPKEFRAKKLINQIKNGSYKGVSITLNTFSYSKLLKHLKHKHYVIWKTSETKDFSKEVVTKIVDSWLIDTNQEYRDYVIYMNDDSKKSIKDIDHYQLFLI